MQLLNSLKSYFERKSQKRSLQKHDTIQTFGFNINEYRLGNKIVSFAQWKHPNESLKTFSDEKINRYKEIIPAGSAVIDIGAHTGDTSVLYACAAGKDGLVIALEPNPYVFRILEENSKLNKDHAAMIIPLNYAATDKDGDFEFLYSDNGYCNGGNLSVIKNQNHKHTFKLKVVGRNLENYIQKNHQNEMNRLSLIKTDTEGYDLFVMKSLENIIKQHRPILICEVLKKFSNEERLELVTYIRSLGYKLYLLNDEGPIKGEEIKDANLFLRPNYDMVCYPQK